MKTLVVVERAGGDVCVYADGMEADFARRVEPNGDGEVGRSEVWACDAPRKNDNTPWRVFHSMQARDVLAACDAPDCTGAGCRSDICDGVRPAELP